MRDGVEGLLVPPGDVAALAAALGELSGAPEKRAALGDAAYARLTDAFSAQAGLDRVAAMLRRSAGEGA